MNFLLILIGVYFIVSKTITKSVNSIFDFKDSDKTTFITHNHITENHLHITKEDLKELN